MACRAFGVIRGSSRNTMAGQSGAYIPSGETIALIPHRRHSPMRLTSDVVLSQSHSCDQRHLSFSLKDISDLCKRILHPRDRGLRHDESVLKRTAHRVSVPYSLTLPKFSLLRSEAGHNCISEIDAVPSRLNPCNAQLA